MGDLAERLLAHLGTADPAHDVAHARRVLSLALRIAKGEGLAVTPSLVAACCLHDLVSLPKDHPERRRASRLAAEAAGPILRNEGLNEDEVTAAQHAIEAHSFSAGITPERAEARVLQDADRIEALGAVGLARVFAVSGALGRALWHPEDPFAEARDVDDKVWALDHFAVKLMHLPQQMNTTTGREIAEVRAGVLQRFLDDLRGELEGVDV